MNRDFTDKVMMKIAAETALRERRRAMWFTTLYILIGVASVWAIATIMNTLGIISFKSIFDSTIISLKEIFATSSLFDDFSAIAADFVSLLSKYHIAVIVTCNLFILYYLSYILGRRKQNRVI